MKQPLVTGLLLRLRLEEHSGEILDLLTPIELEGIEGRLQPIELVRVGRLVDLGLLVVGLERLLDRLRLILEIENEGVFLTRTRLVLA